MRFLDHLDAFGTSDPDFNEGFLEDRCPTCGRPVIDHPCWPHRWHALVEIVSGQGRISDG